MDTTRLKLYEELKTKIGKTPLVQYKGEVPNNNIIYIKRECDNPFGSHYDRVYLALFKHYEDLGIINPGDKILETTSGAAGVSFAGIGKFLGYDCYVALPAGGEKARENAIIRQLPKEDHLILTPAKEYIGGFPGFLIRFLTQNRDYFFFNHSMGPKDRETGAHTNNEVTLGALEEIAEEVLGNIQVNHFIPAVGNGSSILGPGRVFNRFNEIVCGAVGNIMDEASSFGEVRLSDINEAAEYITKIVAFETVQSAVAYDQIYPGQYEKKFGIKPGTLSRHRLPGTSSRGIDFPHIRNAVADRVIDDVILVSDKGIDEEYQRITGRTDTKMLPHWDIKLPNHGDLGRSTRAGISVALEIAKMIKGKNLLVIAYDKAERYDS